MARASVIAAVLVIVPVLELTWWTVAPNASARRYLGINKQDMPRAPHVGEPRTTTAIKHHHCLLSEATTSIRSRAPSKRIAPHRSSGSAEGMTILALIPSIFAALAVA
eukprot:COSAG01_NODE_2280_length_8005_cov_19.621047_3_plen_108_part_00